MNSLYDRAREAFVEGQISWLSDTIHAYLVDAAAYTADLEDDEFLSAIPSQARIGSPVVLTGKTSDRGAVGASPISFTGLSSAPSIEAIVLAQFTGDAATSRLIARIDTGSGLPIPAGQTSVDVAWGTPLFKLGRIPEPPPDTDPPTLTGTVTPSNVQPTTATISWPAATDNVGVTGYRYRRNSSASWIVVGNVLTGSLAGLTATTPYAPEVQARDAAGNWSPSIVGEFTTAAPPVSTKPRFLYAAANPTGDAAIFNAAWSSATELTASADGGKAGTFQTAANSTVYTWIFVLASAAPSGIRVFDGTGYGGFSGALSSALQAGGDPADPITVHVPYTAPDGSAYKAFRSNGRASNSPTLTVS